MPNVSKPNSCAICPYKWKYLNLLDNDDIGAIQNNCYIINFKKGETICKQNSEVTHALFLAKGMVKLYMEQGNKNQILKFVKGGNYIDFQTLFAETYQYSVKAIENVMVCMINKDIILDLTKTNPKYLFQITKAISTSTNTVYKKISSLNQKQVRGRIAESLLELADEIYGSYSFEMNITRKELAEYSSMSMENAVRVLSEYKKDKIIALKGKHVTILEPEILKKLSELG